MTDERKLRLYYVTAREVSVYLVEANSPEEAKREYESGHMEWVDTYEHDIVRVDEDD